MDYHQVVQALFCRVTQGIKLGLGPTQELLAALSNPQTHYRSVLVAGTNGKGSTSALLAEALRHNGQRVGLYTSPHLLDFTERIRVDGQPVPRAHIVRLFERIEALAPPLAQIPTFFETATAMAALAFAEAKVDVAVFEVGLGGRLDATNAIAHELAIITRIGLDHQHLLGDTVQAIAREKAGILRPGMPVLVAPQDAVVTQVLEAEARRVGATWHQAQADTALPQGFPGYQASNVGTARRAAEVLGCKADAFEAALRSFHWPGRYQLLTGAPDLLLDGAHNDQGLQAFCDAFRLDTRFVGRPMAGVFSCVAGKPVQAMAAKLRSLPMPWFVCPTQSARTLSSRTLATHLPGSTPCDGAAQALARARTLVGARGLVIGVGSLFLVADLLAASEGVTSMPAFDG